MFSVKLRLRHAILMEKHVIFMILAKMLEFFRENVPPAHNFDEKRIGFGRFHHNIRDFPQTLTSRQGGLFVAGNGRPKTNFIICDRS